MRIGVSELWPLLGVESSVDVKNPGMSVWVFVILGKIFSVTNPIELAQAVQILNLIGLALLTFFTFTSISKTEREPWFWTIALASVNPFAVIYQRKIWAQSILPFFMVILLIFWWRKNKPLFAFLWGLVAAVVCQIHLSGMFFVAGFLLWNFFAEKYRDLETVLATRWRDLISGGFIGSITAIPWLHHLFSFSNDESIFSGLSQLLQLRFWVFWITDPLGLHVGNFLGVQKGNSFFAQLGDFIKLPLISGHPTYFLGLIHLLLLAIGSFFIITGLIRSFCSIKTKRCGLRDIVLSSSMTGQCQKAVILGYGLLITLSTIRIKRFYLLITFPFEFLWIARLALAGSSLKRARILLGILFVAQLILSAGFLSYIHVNGGAPQGDYGHVYRLQPKILK